MRYWTYTSRWLEINEEQYYSLLLEWRDHILLMTCKHPGHNGVHAAYNWHIKHVGTPVEEMNDAEIDEAVAEYEARIAEHEAEVEQNEAYF